MKLSDLLRDVNIGGKLSVRVGAFGVIESIAASKGAKAVVSRPDKDMSEQASVADTEETSYKASRQLEACPGAIYARLPHGTSDRRS